MGVFGAVCGRRGDAGFSAPLLGACSGVVGFIVAMFLRPVRQICRPVRPGVCVSAKKLARRQCSHRVGANKFSLQAQYGRKMLFLGVLGELCRGNAAGRAALGELCRGKVVRGLVLGEFFRGPAVV